ncbi:bifunctional 3-phenylpropionate/cinnamic acid dioxygenase ferredoxin subunit [Paraburkholderia sediminicola]|uniref:bifunctional 3-phenylpropionate/cinnamic acid dioxygenase ferredoxin subunit n=1 Tax=Paraburkholderia sediminicola TaxID=458836 RepID=UPI000E70728D
MIKVCETDAVADGEVLRVELDGLVPLAVYNTEGEFFVTDDTCSHGDASLAEGFLEGTEIECPWHSGKFCLRTGRALTFPAVEPIRVYPVTLEGNAILIPTPTGEAVPRGCSGECRPEEAGTNATPART